MHSQGISLQCGSAGELSGNTAA
uniref:Uncharacterized protein n=1 Tax=Anguilla anguilla TaxID=7936 RepID=A0A0E9PJZ6_ANGAN